ncbi:Zinc finger BED domain-containing protein RICESLEEPER 2, partial [Linum perenne]
ISVKNAPIDHQPSNEVIKNSTTGEYDFDLYVSQRKRSKTAAYQIELDSYLNEAIIPRSSDFDILMWWKMNGVKFQTLQAIAKDVLAIPITSVASEYSFSAGGRLLDPHHSRLHYTMVESMMCTRSWIKDDLKLGISNIS